MTYFIGMHSTFDDRKYERDYYNKIAGIEFCNFASSEEIENVVKKSIEDGFDIGIHFPFNKNNYKYRDPLVVSNSKFEREEAFLALEKEIKFAASSNAKYLLLHFPKPVIISRNLEWGKAKLNDFEFLYDDQMNFSEFKRLSEEAFERLDKLSGSHSVPIVLEIELINEWLYSTNLLESLLEKYENVSLCLDTARLHVIDKIDPKFDMNAFVKRFSKYTSNLHIANIQVDSGLKNGHYPALPTLDESDNWCNISELLLNLKCKSKLKSVLFEHRSDIVSNDELDECYEWIDDLLSINT